MLHWGKIFFCCHYLVLRIWGRFNHDLHLTGISLTPPSSSLSTSNASTCLTDSTFIHILTQFPSSHPTAATLMQAAIISPLGDCKNIQFLLSLPLPYHSFLHSRQRIFFKYKSDFVIPLLKTFYQLPIVFKMKSGLLALDPQHPAPTPCLSFYSCLESLFLKVLTTKPLPVGPLHFHKQG